MSHETSEPVSKARVSSTRISPRIRAVNAPSFRHRRPRRIEAEESLRAFLTGCFIGGALGIVVAIAIARSVFGGTP